MLKASVLAAACLAATSAVVAQEPRTDRSPSALTGRDSTVLTVYGQPGLTGTVHSFSLPTGNVSTMQRYESLRTSGGPWQVCDRHEYQGECRVVEGRYLTLSQIGLRQIRSIRPVQKSKDN